MPIYIDPTIQLQVWCVDDSIKRNIHPDSFITDQHSGGLIGQTRGALYVPYNDDIKHDSVSYSVYWTDGTVTMSTDSNLEGITHGNTKIIVSDDLSYAELPKDRLETIYELVAGPGTSTVGVALIVRNRQQNALPGILRGISTLPSNAPLEDVINTVNQIILNAREAQLMSAQVITDIPAQGNYRQPDGPRGVSNRPGF